MVSSTKSVSLSLALPFLLFTIAYSTCNEPFNQILQKRSIRNCKKLATLGAELGWNYYTGNKTEIDIIFGVNLKETPSWVAWGLNPGDQPQMFGTKAIIAVVQPNGSLSVETYSITGSTKIGCQLLPSVVDFEVKRKEAESSNTSGYFTLSATLVLPSAKYNISNLNHVWQVGFSADGLQPMQHPATIQNFDSTDTIDLIAAKNHGIGRHRRHLRMMHGILNIVGWGICLPIGVIIARYFRKFPYPVKCWYILHVSCQIVGYSLGTAGWAIGLWLGHASRHYAFRTHRILAIFIFAFTSLQMLALRLKPKPHDDYRKYWDMYHHFLGYALLAVISVNIFQGIHILKPDVIWKWSYVGVLVVLALIVLVFEICTWTKFIKPKKDQNKQSQPSANQPQASVSK